MTHTTALLRFALTCCLLVAAPAHAQRPPEFRARQDASTGSIRVYRADSAEPILTQEAEPGFRPFLHPIVAPDGDGVLTQSSPDHHRHQTGLYFGFTRLNGRDYFHNPGAGYWRRRASEVKTADGESIAWRTEYDMLDEAGESVLREAQEWSMRERDGRFVLDLVWRGTANVDVTIGKYDYGGLFLRMPWKPGIAGAVTNAARQIDAAAEGQPAPWIDVGMAIDGREDHGHIAIFDHHENAGFPQRWRVDGQLGVGPVRARTGDWTIPQGETATIRHRFVVYTGAFDSLGITEAWKEYTGRDYTWSLWGIAREEGKRAKFLSPREAVDAMTVTPGFEVNAWASEPMLTQPMAFCWDDRGRMWIAENRDYESRGKGFANSGDSRILILEDTDRDGVADTRKVFLTGVPFPTAVAVGMGGLWLGAPPNLLFVPDADGDDVADRDAIEVRLTGWGIRDRHETLNSLHWGPDGWLYGCQGFATPSLVGKPAGDGRLPRAKRAFPKDLPLRGEGTPINGGVWRYHPTKDRFEVVAHGFSNPWGIDYDAKGQLFITACVIPHLWHIVPGGIYHRQGGRHFNPYVYDDLKTIVDHTHRSAHGGARVYLSDAFPREYHGQLFMANMHEHAVLADVLEPVGSSFVAHHGSDFLHANNAQWIGFSVEIGPGGDLFVLDWHDADICGTSVLNKDTGRIFRIAPTHSNSNDWPGRYGDLAALGDAELVQLQRSASAWHARRARVILQGRAAAGVLGGETHAALRQMFETDSNADWRLRALWALHVTGGATESLLAESLGDRDPHVRAWAIQLLCEDEAPRAVLARFAELAREDPSPVVRLYLAAALQRIDHAARWPIARALVARGGDADDHNIPKMVWFGIEPCVPGDPARALELAVESELPGIAKKVARRLTAAERVEALVGVIAQPSRARRDLLTGLCDELAARKDPRPPENWASAHAALLDDTAVGPLVAEIAQRFGDRTAVRQLLATIEDRGAAPVDRTRAVRVLANARDAELRGKLPGLLDDAALRAEAIRAVAAYDDAELVDLLLSRYAQWSEADRLTVVQTLAARPGYGRRLTDAIRDGAVPKRDVPAYVARQLRRVVGAGFVDVWGPVDQLEDDQAAAFRKYRALLTDDAVARADPRRGRAVFGRACAACHRMYGEGADIGPDITGSNRADLDYILSNILAPSEEIQEGYELVLITTRDGRTWAGNLATEDERQVTLRVVGSEEAVVVPKSEIRSRDVAPVSIMPPGLLSTLTDAEVLDLMAFLRTTSQVELPDGGEGK